MSQAAPLARLNWRRPHKLDGPLKVAREPMIWLPSGCQRASDGADNDNEGAQNR